MATTKQVSDKSQPPNPTGKGGFGDNPQNRHDGAWKKEDTPRFKLEQMMKLSDKELKQIGDDKEAPLFERKLAKAIINGQWGVIRDMVHEVYGTPKQTTDITTGGKPISPIVRIIDERKDK